MASHIKNMQEPQAISYDPSDTGKLTDHSQKKFHVFYANLCSYRDALSPNLKTKMTDQKMKDLAHSLLDDTVFDIVQELEDIQSLCERRLLHKRMKVVGHHKTMKMEITKKHIEDVARNRHKPHHMPILKTEHDKQKSDLDKKLADELRRTDQEVILELDQIVSDQQSTLFRTAVPFFCVTNSSQDIQVQMHILRFIQKLSQIKDAEQI